MINLVEIKRSAMFLQPFLKGTISNYIHPQETQLTYILQVRHVPKRIPEDSTMCVGYASDIVGAIYVSSKKNKQENGLKFTDRSSRVNEKNLKCQYTANIV